MSAITPEQADKLLHLTGELVSQVLQARALGRSISRIEAIALADALQFLQDYQIAWSDTLVRYMAEYDELCAQEQSKSELIRLPRVNSLSKRISGALGLS